MLSPQHNSQTSFSSIVRNKHTERKPQYDIKGNFVELPLEALLGEKNALGLFAENMALLTQQVKQTKEPLKQTLLFQKCSMNSVTGYTHCLLPQADCAEIHVGTHGFTDEFIRNLKYLLTADTQVRMQPMYSEHR